MTQSTETPKRNQDPTASEELTTRLREMERLAEARNEALMAEQNKVAERAHPTTMRKRLAKIAMGTTAEDHLEATAEAGKANFALRTIRSLTEIAYQAPKTEDAPHGFEATFTRNHPGNKGRIGFSEQTEHSLKVRPIDDPDSPDNGGISLKVTNQSDNETWEPVTQSYFISQEGRLYSEHGDPATGDLVRSEMEHDGEEMVRTQGGSEDSFLRGHDYEGPSQSLAHDMRDFEGACKPAYLREGLYRADASYGEHEFKPLPEPMPEAAEAHHYL